MQDSLRKAIEVMVHHPVRALACSRTDAGVHARATAVTFDTWRTIPEHGFQRGLNANLPDDIAVLAARDRPVGWRARDAAVAKTYRYRVQLGRAAAPLWSRHAWWPKATAVDLDAMAEAAATLLGEHDFSAFRAAGCDARTPIRHIHHITFEPVSIPGRSSDGELTLLDIVVTGNAFLRNMVRIVAGTLVEVGLGRRTPEDVAGALASRSRPRAGRTAPGHGLTLWAVHFEGYPRLGKGPPAGGSAADSADVAREGSAAG